MATRINEFQKIPIPADLAQRQINISENAMTVLKKRYLRRGEDGKPVETIQEMFWRVAYHVALAEQELGGDAAQVDQWARRFFDLLTNVEFFPNSPTFTGAGTPLGQLAACFVLKIEDDMGRTGSGIFETLRHAALIQQTGGGNGFAFSRLRPKGALVRSSNGTATGPLGFLRVYDQAFGEIAQGGCLVPDTLVFTERGLLRLDEIVQHADQGWRGHELSVSTDAGMRASYQGFNNGVSPVLRVQTDAGLELTGTPNHKVKVMTADGPTWRRLDELQAGDAILVKLGQHQGHLQALDVPAKQHGNQQMPHFKTVLDEELAFFIGYLMGDGFITARDDDHRVGVSVAHSSYLMKAMPAILEELFGVTVHEQQKPNDASVTFVMDNRAVKDYLLLNGFEKAKSAYVRVPRLIRQSPPAVVGAFLRGLFEADGSLSHGYPQLLSTSETLIREVATLLIGLGCPVQIGQTAGAWSIQPTEPARFQEAIAQRHHMQQMALAGVSPIQDYADAPDINDLWFVAVQSVETAGEALTLDIEVEDNHTYLANGMVTHNSRRGANMAVLRVDHPDIRDFIKSKSEEGTIANFNISVGITDEFMQAVERGTTFDLRFNDKVYETVDARELFDMVVQYAHHNGEPGMLFLDAANRENPVPHLYELESTNPCVTGDMRIYTDEGLIRARDLFDEETTTKVVIDGRFGHAETFAQASRVFLTGEKQVYRLQTKEGYYLRATADHKIMTPRGWWQLKDLRPGDQIHILNRKGGFGQTGSEALGRVLGWLIGDGTIVNNIRAVLSFFGEEKRQLAPIFAQHVNELVAPLTTRPRTYTVGVTEVADRDEARISSERLLAIATEHGLVENKHRVPESVFVGTETMQRGFLQALFTADGSFQDGKDKGGSIRLAANQLELLEGVQQLLLNFGIASRIYRERRTAGYRNMPNGQGGLSPYWCEAQHELVISKQNMVVFADEIGFLMDYKQQGLEDYIHRGKRGPKTEAFTATVKSITEEGIEEVFDLNELLTNSFTSQGIIIHNCGEQWLGPFENCCLGSVNLAQHVTDDGHVLWDKLADSVATATRFLDDVVTANAYVPAIPQLREAAENVRRIGLGIMGLADMMYAMGVRYGSPEGQEFASQVMEYVRYHSVKTSIDLAEERGPFLAIEGSRYDPNNLKWTAPKSLVRHKTDWQRPTLDWKGIEKGLKAHGIRNGAQTTIAPTGTLSTVAGCEGYGCEPVFALAYIRYVNTNAGNSEERFTLQYTSPHFERALRHANLDQATIDRIVEQVNMTGSCQDVPEVPEHIRHVFVTANDITAEEHIRMQAVMQAHIDNSISKTCNFPSEATEDDVAKAYMLGWKLGCKGLTVYVTGSREKVVLETAATREKREGTSTEAAVEPKKSEQMPLFNEKKKPRPGLLPGRTYRLPTPVGTTYVTINENGYGQGQPFEVFVHTAKAGSETAAVSEALGRLLSLILRQASPVSPRDRVKEMVRQLLGIGGGRQTGFGPNRVASLPDGIAQVLQQYLVDSSLDENEDDLPDPQNQLGLFDAKPASNENGGGHGYVVGDLCPECGDATLVREEGCLHCYSCGYSEC